MTRVANPVLRGFHPDPCLCRARGKYYLATSTFQWVPAVSLYESDDLVEWRPLGGALRNIDLRGVPDSAGIWAPDLSYDEKSGLFWLAYTVARQIDGIFKDVSNYVVTAADPRGPWSAPVFLNASGFDPGIYHEDGRHYVINPQWDPRPLSGHHRFNGLVMQEFSLEHGLVGRARTVLGNDDAVNWLREGPHVMKREGWYYIACAEGGTGRRHRIRMARSRELWGPYEACPEPLLCAWCADTPLRRAGHGNLVQGPDDSWYVCHLCSRYLPRRDGLDRVFDEHEEGFSPLGRETALQRVVWKDGWPRLAQGGVVPTVEIEITGAFGGRPPALRPGEPGWRYETRFEGGTDLWREGWLAPRCLTSEFWGCGDKGLMLSGGDSPSSMFDRACLSRRVTSLAWRAQTTLSFEPAHYNQTAGLIVEYDARAFVYLQVAYDERLACRVVDVVTNLCGEFASPLGQARPVVPAGARDIALCVDVDGYGLRLSWAVDGDDPSLLHGESGEPCVLDASLMSDEAVPGWAYTGTMVGVTCVDMWDKTARASFRHFVYEDGGTC